MPRPPRFFISPEQVSGQQVSLSGEDVRHIATVLRMKPGEELLLCDGQGTDYAARVTQVTKSEIVAEITGQSKREPQQPRILLGQGLPKSDKMDWIAQKATELGVGTIVPIVTERTIMKVRDEGKRVSRWQKIAREAAMQSNRPDIPLVDPIVPFSEFLRTLNSEPGTLLLFPWEEGTLPVKDILCKRQDIKKIVVLIGPEGGFSQKEAELAKAKGFHLVSLGRNILRTETAAIAVLSMIGYEYFY